MLSRCLLGIIFILLTFSTISSGKECRDARPLLKSSCNQLIFDKCIQISKEKTKHKDTYKDILFKDYLKKNNKEKEFISCQKKNLEDKVIKILPELPKLIMSLKSQGYSIKEIILGNELEQASPFQIHSGIFSFNPYHKWTLANTANDQLSELYFKYLTEWRSLKKDSRTGDLAIDNKLFTLINSKKAGPKNLIELSKEEALHFSGLRAIFKVSELKEIKFSAPQEIYILDKIVSHIFDLHKFVINNSFIFYKDFQQELSKIAKEKDTVRYILDHLGEFRIANDFINNAIEDCSIPEFQIFEKQLLDQLAADKNWQQMWKDAQKRYESPTGVRSQFINFLKSNWAFTPQLPPLDNILNVFNKSPLSDTSRNKLLTFLKNIDFNFHKEGYIPPNAFYYSPREKHIIMGINNVYEIFSNQEWLKLDMVLAHELAHAIQDFIFWDKSSGVSGETISSYNNIVNTCFKKESKHTENEDMADFFASNFLNFMKNNNINRNNMEPIFQYYCKAEVFMDRELFLYHSTELQEDVHTNGYKRLLDLFNHSKVMQDSFDCTPEFYCIYE